MENKRKIIQIQALRFEGVADEDSKLPQETELIALCDDGSVWTRLTTDPSSYWVRVDDIPQD